MSTRSSKPNFVQLDNISVQFKSYDGFSSSLKETVMQWITQPAWHKEKKKNRKTLFGLKNVDLKIKEGDRLGVLGLNGAGKSTLLKVISRIYRPTNGTVTVQGRVAPLIEIGAGFSPELTGRENAFLNGAILGMSRKMVKERLDNIIAFSELGDSMDMPVKYFSTGMQLRLAFSLATEVQPEILILDELFAGADAQFIEKANERLEKFVYKSKILILVSHNLEDIRRFCNRAIVLDQGEVKARGLPEEMIERYLAHVDRKADAFEENTAEGDIVAQPVPVV